MRRILWIVVGAAVIAAVFAVPSLGGPSLTQQLTALVLREKKLEKRVNALAKRPLPRGRQGPAGPAGPAGPRGETGPRGATGAQAVLEARVGTTGSGPLGTSTTTLVTLNTARAGGFLVEANAVFANTGGGVSDVTCELVVVQTSELIDTAAVTLEASGGLDTESLALSGALTASGPATVQLQCEGSASGISFSDADMVVLG